MITMTSRKFIDVALKMHIKYTYFIMLATNQTYVLSHEFVINIVIILSVTKI